ncbi:IS3 family transposase [Vibrio jasicida]|uniref:IS3 family transposase n=1 Tax=Vibrio jasicida TaxID=766224 RepID=UPI0040678780
MCDLFDIVSSCYYELNNANRIRLASRVKQLFNMSRGVAGWRTLASMLRTEVFAVGRFKVRKLMQEAELMS